MPCYDSRDSPEYKVQEARRDFRHNSDVAEMLCYLLKQVDAVKAGEEFELKLTPQIMLWWQEHKIRDAKKEGESRV